MTAKDQNDKKKAEAVQSDPIAEAMETAIETEINRPYTRTRKLPEEVQKKPAAAPEESKEEAKTDEQGKSLYDGIAEYRATIEMLRASGLLSVLEPEEDREIAIKAATALLSAKISDMMNAPEAVPENVRKHMPVIVFAQLALIVGLRNLQKDPAFADYTLEDIVTESFKDGKPIAGPCYDMIITAMQKTLEAGRELQDICGLTNSVPKITVKNTDMLNYPLDKPNHVIWNLIADAAKTTPDGQLRMVIDTGRKGSNQDAGVYYGINFDELEPGVKFTKQLTTFDKRCYIAAAALYNGGNPILSATQVYRMMGNPGTPRASDLQRINDSLTKMGAARVFIDNEKEVSATKGGYEHFRYDAALLPFERISAYINGQLTESAIHLFREPPLMSFARQRHQITTISRQLLESPINKTDANLRIDDYLLERIGHMKSGKGRTPRKMLYATIYNNCEIKTAKQKQRAPEKIRRYLDHYQQCGWIKGYEEAADGITILL